MSDNLPPSIRSRREVAQKSAAYRAQVAAGLIDAQGNPITPDTDPPQYDGHGHRTS